MDTDQRRIPLAPVSTQNNTYSFLLPSDPGIIVPGLWWMFAINHAGVPSVGFQTMVRPPAAWSQQSCLTLACRTSLPVVGFLPLQTPKYMLSVR